MRGFVAAALAIVAVGAIWSATRGSDQYELTAQMSNAAGIRTGSSVRQGGAVIGKVTEVSLGPHDVAQARISFNEGIHDLPRDTRFAIKAPNLLGEKFLELERGHSQQDLASGAKLPARAVTSQPELDQLLDVLDPQTRARAQVLINELGRAVTGHEKDFSAMLKAFPGSLDGANQVVSTVADDNRELGRLVEITDGFVTRTAKERRQLGNLVTSGAGALDTIESRSTELAEAIRQSPATISSLRTWLTKLRAVAEPLAPAADSLAATAPQLQHTLAVLPAFTAAAAPTLAQARAAAPSLSALLKDARPTIKTAVPTLSTLARVARESPPLTRTADASIDDILGWIEGWARATQTRDGIGHTFRGDFTVPASLMTLLVKRVLGTKDPQPGTKTKTDRRPVGQGDAGPSKPTSTLRPTAKPKLPEALEPVQGIVDGILPVIDKLLGGQGKTTDQSQHQGDGSNSLLDYLLGK